MHGRDAESGHGMTKWREGERRSGDRLGGEKREGKKS